MKRVIVWMLLFSWVLIGYAARENPNDSFMNRFFAAMFKTKQEAPVAKPVVPVPAVVHRTAPPLSKKYFPQTELSKKAMRLQNGMTREGVLAILGAPTWAQSYKGMPLDWSWRNGNCNPVDVTFDERLRVNGFNQGRATCLDVVFEDVPGDDSLCQDPHVSTLCGLKFQFQRKHPLAPDRKYHSLSTQPH